MRGFYPPAPPAPPALPRAAEPDAAGGLLAGIPVVTNSKAKLGSPLAASNAITHLSLAAPVKAIKLASFSSSTGYAGGCACAVGCGLG